MEDPGTQFSPAIGLLIRAKGPTAGSLTMSCFQGLSATATGEASVPVTTVLEAENGSMPTGSPTLAMFTQSIREVDTPVSSLSILPLLGLVPGRSRH